MSAAQQLIAALAGALSIPAISVGANATLGAFTTNYMDLAGLSTTKSIAIYREIGVPRTAALVVNDAGGTITKGTTTQVEAANNLDTAIEMISSTKAIGIWAGPGAVGKCAILNVSGNTITVVTPVTHEAAGGSLPRICVLSSTQALCVHGTATKYLQVLDINGSDLITPASRVTFTGMSNSQAKISLVPLTSTTALLTYFDTSSNSLKGCIITVTGSVPSFGSLQTITTGGSNTQFPGVKNLAMLDASTFISMCATNVNNYLYLSVISLSGGTLAVTAPTPIAANAAVSNNFVLAKIDTQRALCAYMDGSNQIQLIVVTKNGTYGAVTNTGYAVSVGGGNNPIALVQLTATTFLCTYFDSSNNPFGFVVTLT